MGDGNLERGSWQSRGKIHVVRNPGSRLHLIDLDFELISRFKRARKNCLLKPPFLLTSLFYSCRIFLHNSFINEKTQTSNGCNKSIALAKSITKQSSFCSAILITWRLKCEAKLSPKSTYFPGFSATVFMKISTNHCWKPARFCDIVNRAFQPNFHPWFAEGTLQRQFHITWLIRRFHYDPACFY